jgi:hypothetical protein
VSDELDAQFRFNRTALARPRPPGISAIMRIKNGADFLRLSIESHLPYVDEVVACYNDCSDATPQEARMECFRFDPAHLYKRYVGLLHFHLKHLEPGASHQCLDEAARTEWLADLTKRFRWQSFADFSSPASFLAFKSNVNAAEYWLRTQAWSQGLIHWLSGRNLPQKIARLARLGCDLKALDFQRDLADRLQTP